MKHHDAMTEDELWEALESEEGLKLQAPSGEPVTMHGTRVFLVDDLHAVKPADRAAVTEWYTANVAPLRPVAAHVARSVCHPDTTCPTCQIALVPEHAHSRCPKCGYRDSCCF